MSPNALPTTLPVLRPDIEFHLGPAECDGAPTYVLHDPLRGTFEKLTWVQAEILRRLRVPWTLDRLLAHLRSESTIRVSADDITRLCADAAGRGLTCGQLATPRRTSLGGIATLFRRLVYLRVPLCRPDAFLARTVGTVRHLASPAALTLYLAFTLAGLIWLVQRFDAYLATFPYFFNAAGAATFTLAIIAIKTIHEFSHAYVAKALGNRVPSMGVALIFLFPVAYADVTDSWRMRSRRRRLPIALAGVLAELVLAGLALFIWGISPPGTLKSLCFVVSSVTLVSTLVLNLNPARRYDGYYVLSDLLGIDNLQSRALAVLRWLARRHLLGLPLPPPEAPLPRRRLVTLVAYALGASAYRAVLYAAIALMLYHWLAKALGVIVFCAALYTFIIRPIVHETVQLWRLRPLWRWNWRAPLVAALVLLILLWAALPLPRRQSVPATTVAGDTQVLYAPGAGVLRELHVALNDQVKAGQTLFVVESADLNAQAEIARLDIERLDVELAVIKSDARQRALLPQKTEELARAQARLDSLRAAIERNRCVAQVDGVVMEWDDSVREGTPISADQVLGRIVDGRAPRIVGYVRDDLAGDVTLGTRLAFCSDAEPGRLAGTVTFVEPVRSTVLEQRGLASVARGDIAVVPDAHGRLEMLDSYYKVEVALDAPPPELRVGQTGALWLRTSPRSRLADLWRYVQGVVLRESSF